MDLSNVCQQLSPTQHVLVILAVLAWEAWLGRTDKTKSGSTLELILNTAKSLFNRVVGVKPEEPPAP